jgi:hypothetical protein
LLYKALFEALSVHQALVRVMILWELLTNLNMIAPIMTSLALFTQSGASVNLIYPRILI